MSHLWRRVAEVSEKNPANGGGCPTGGAANPHSAERQCDELGEGPAQDSSGGARPVDVEDQQLRGRRRDGSPFGRVKKW